MTKKIDELINLPTGIPYENMNPEQQGNVHRLVDNMKKSFQNLNKNLEKMNSELVKQIKEHEFKRNNKD